MRVFTTDEGKILLYVTILLVLAAAIDCVLSHARRSGLTDIKIECDKKDFSRTFLTVALVFTVLFGMIFQLPSNQPPSMEKKIHIGCIIFTEVLYFLAFIYHRWYFIVRRNEILYCTLLGIPKTIPLSEITGFDQGDYMSINIYRNSKKVFVIDDPGDYADITKALRKARIPDLNTQPAEFVVRAPFSYWALLLILSVLGPGFMIGVGIYIYTFEIVLMGSVMGVVFIVGSIRMCSEKFTVKDRHIRRTKLLGRTIDLPFEEVEEVLKVYENNAPFYHFYSDVKIVLKVMMYYKNSGKLERLVLEQGWLNKKMREQQLMEAEQV